MTKLLEQMVETVQLLSPKEQDAIARAVIEMVGGIGNGAYSLSKHERAAINIAREQVGRGEYASEEEVDALFKKYAS